MNYATCVLVLLVAMAGHCAANATTAPASAPNSTEQSASLETLDRIVSRFEALLNRDDDAKHKFATQMILDEFKQRAAAIHQNFDQSRYDELKVDLNREYQRCASWMNPPVTPPPTTNPSHP